MRTRHYEFTPDRQSTCGRLFDPGERTEILYSLNQDFVKNRRVDSTAHVFVCLGVSNIIEAFVHIRAKSYIYTDIIPRPFAYRGNEIVQGDIGSTMHYKTQACGRTFDLLYQVEVENDIVSLSSHQMRSDVNPFRNCHYKLYGFNGNENYIKLYNRLPQKDTKI